VWHRLRLTVLSPLLAGSLLLAGAGAAPAQTPPPTVPIKVVKRGGNTLVIAPVTINGRSLQFIVDTGAGVSVIGRRAARRLQLPAAGRTVRVGGVFGLGTGHPVPLRAWQLGGVPLPALKILAADLGARGRLVGLLGSDVLSRFGRVSIDYARRTLTLGG
jgi:predicted aspartyl protease